MSGYGPHLTLDLFNANPTKLSDVKFCEDFLLNYPGKIGMTLIDGPRVFFFKSEIPSESGVTGYSIIAESHISIHTYPRKKFAFIDIFSCKYFDHESVKDEIISIFEADKMLSDYAVTRRGRLFNR